MKQLNNNFTTPEQSKRLLELGLPVDSADCVIATYNGIMKHSILCYHYSSYGEFVEKAGNTAAIAAIHPNEEYIPCWSVGRLIEIYLRCCSEQLVIKRAEFGATDLVSMLEIKHLKGLFDFSKLEE